MTISRREKILIFILIVAVLGFLFVRLVYLPNDVEIQALQADNQELKLEKQNLENLRRQQELSSDTQIRTMAELRVLEAKLPVEEELVPMMRFVDEIARDSGMLLLSLTYKEEQAKTTSGAGKLTFDVGTSGSIFAIINFLQALNDAPRLISIGDVVLTAAKKEAPQVKDNAKSVPSYYIPPPGIPEAKGNRYKLEVIEEEQASQSVQSKTADSILRDMYKLDMKITMYYFAKEDNAQEPKEAKNQDNKGV